MLSSFSRVIFASTSVAPVFLTLAVMACIEKKIIYFWILLVLCILCLFSFIYILTHLKMESGETKISINSLSQGNKEITSYFLTYLFPIIGSDAILKNHFVFGFFIIMLLIYTAFSTSFNFNPLFSIKYRYYTASDLTGRNIILITRKAYNGKKCEELRKGNFKDIPVTEITPYIYLMTGEPNYE